MNRKHLTTLITAGLITASFGAGVARAAGTRDDGAEVKAFQDSATSLTAAIAAAEKASGGTAISAEFDHARSGPLFEVDTVNGTKAFSVKIDAASGKVLASDAERTEGEDDDHVDPATLPMPLAQAIAKAEADGTGKVMAISADGKDGKTHGLEVELAAADGTTRSVLLAADGKMTPLIDHEDEEGDEDMESKG